METDSPVVYHGTSESRFSPEQIRNKQIQLSQEEIRIFRECNRESFYYRCLPFAVAGMAATFLAIKNGYLKSHHRWGPAGKMTGAAFVGWILGKLSYRRICEDKFLKLENSSIADAIRKKKGYVLETFESERKSGSYDENLSLKDDNYTTYGNDDYHSSSGSLNLDVDKNVPYSGLDDRERPTTDREALSFGEATESPQKYITYEELRKKNREAYERQRQGPSQNKTESQPLGTRRSWSHSDNDRSKLYSESQLGGSTKNAYGDAWDNPKFS